MNNLGWDIPIDNVRSYQKAKEIRKILSDPNPTHNQRLYLVGFLKSVGYSEGKVWDLIRNYAKWEDFDGVKTKYQIRSVFQVKIPRPPAFGKNEKKAGGESSPKMDIPFQGDITKADLLKPYNDIFLHDANKCKYWVSNGRFQGMTDFPDDSTNALINAFYRSIEGNNHILFVVDIDRNNLNDAFVDAQLIYAHNPDMWDFVKFSGNRGFHLIQKIPLNGRGYDYKLLKEKGKQIEDILGIEIDRGMFQRNRLIRGYSINFKSGLCSIPVDLEHDNLDDILRRARTLELSEDNSGKISTLKSMIGGK